MFLPRVSWSASLAGVLCAASGLLSPELGSWTGGGSAMSWAQDGGPKPEELFAQLDKNQDGKLTRDEVPTEQQRFFERAVRVGDKDNDGALTREEFLQGTRPAEGGTAPLPAFQGAGDRRGELRERFEMMDRNKDGKVTLEEVPEPFRDRLRSLFERLGKDALNLDEFSRVSAAGGLPGGPGNRPEPGEMFQRMDRNGDGKVSKDELPEGLQGRLSPLFERLGKESLTREDLPEVLKLMAPGSGQPGAGRSSDGAMADGRGPEGRGPMGGPQFLQLLDGNRDGRISKEEWAKAGPLFDQLDGNKDGQLDLRELIGAGPGPTGNQPGGPGFAGGPGAPGNFGRRPEGDMPNRPDDNRPDGNRPDGNRPDAAGLFERMDRNKDGKLSKDEAPERMREFFDRLDKDGDAFLTPDEVRNGLGEMFRGRPGANPGPGNSLRPNGAGPNGAGPNGDTPRPKRPASDN